MGHHHHATPKKETQLLDLPTNYTHPFFEANDLAVLSLVLPFLSERGKYLVSFFVNFGSQNTLNANDAIAMLKQLSPKMQNNPLIDLLPIALNILSNPDNKSALNPSMISSILGNLNSKKEEET